MLGRWTGLIVACVVALVVLAYGYYGTESRQIRRERYQAIAAIGTLNADQLQLLAPGAPRPRGRSVACTNRHPGVHGPAGKSRH